MVAAHGGNPECRKCLSDEGMLMRGEEAERVVAVGSYDAAHLLGASAKGMSGDQLLRTTGEDQPAALPDG